jgi:hypothetical protein
MHVATDAASPANRATAALPGSSFSTEPTVGCVLTCGVESASTLAIKPIFNFNFESTIGLDV